ncbi:hypothetical protein JCM10207_009067 [Rhodosporidiobolus poonsookiae]
MPRAFPLASLRLKVSKTTLLIPVSSSTTLSALRATALEALAATATTNADDPDLPAVPESADDVALWRLDKVEADEAGLGEKWVRLTDEKSGADKWGVGESEELGVSFRGADGTFPKPTVVRPVDDYEEQ